MLREWCHPRTVGPDAEAAIEASGIPLAVAWLGHTSTDVQRRLFDAFTWSFAIGTTPTRA
jgi:hypothetical protein